MVVRWQTIAGGGALAALCVGFFIALECRERSAKEPFDADGYLADGMTEAASRAPGAELESIEITYVTPDARVHTEYSGQFRATWVAPDDTEEGKAVMPGAPRKGGGRCTDLWLTVRLEHDPDTTYLDDDMNMMRDRDCYKKTAPGPLFCTVKAIWKRAIAAGAPNPGLATIKLETLENRTRMWHFTIVDNVQNGPQKTLFSGDYPDNCEPAVER